MLDEAEKLLRDAPVIGNPFGEAATFDRAIFRLPEDDLETLLRTANERWNIESRLEEFSPRPLHMFHESLRAYVAAGSTLGALWETLRAGQVRATGGTPDVRDSEQIAEQFLHVVHAGAQQDGGANMETHIERAREAVLEGVPTHYRRRVLERILDREEEALRQGGASEEDAKALEEARDERRARGWAALAGKGSGRTR